MTKNIFTAMALVLTSSASMATTVECGIVRMTNQDTKRIVDASLECSQKQAQVVISEIGSVIFACENTGSEIKIQVLNAKDNSSISTGNALSTTRKSFSSYYLTLEQSLAINCELK